MGNVKDRYKGQEKAEIVFFRAFGFSQWQTTEEFQRRHPNPIHDPSRQRSVGRIRSRFQVFRTNPRAGPLRTSPDDEFSNVILVKIAVLP